MAAVGRFQVKWYAGRILKEMGAVVATEEKDAAQRVMLRVKKKVPVRQKSYGHSRSIWNFSNYRHAKAWKTRSPGRLKRSIRMAKSKFKGGGYLVFAGGAIPYYAYWVEHGTIFTFRQKYGRKGEQFMKRSVALEKARFMRNMRKRLGV
jgi:hypothetical protein